MEPKELSDLILRPELTVDHTDEIVEAVNTIYDLSGLVPPEKVIFCPSPLVGCMVRELCLRSGVGGVFSPSGRRSVKKDVWKDYGEVAWNVLQQVPEEGLGLYAVGETWKSKLGSKLRKEVFKIPELNWNRFSGRLMEYYGRPRHEVSLSFRNGAGSASDAIFSDFNNLRWLLALDLFKHNTKVVDSYFTMLKYAGLFWFHERVALVSEKFVQLRFDEEERLHNAEGPAILYPDGWSSYFVRGVRVPKEIILDPANVSVSKITKERNIEVRRIMIDLYGMDKFLLNSGAIKLQEDDFGALYVRKFVDDEDIMMVKVVNSTPEPDGTFKDYFIRVPPTMTTSKEAVAWTFEEDHDDYKPLKET